MVVLYKACRISWYPQMPICCVYGPHGIPASVEGHSEDELAAVHAAVDVEVDGVEGVVEVAGARLAGRHLLLPRDERRVVPGELPVVPFFPVLPVPVVVVGHDVHEVKVL